MPHRFPCLALIATALVASAAEDPVAADRMPLWYATAKAPGYDDATAHQPRLEDRRLWPTRTGQEKFATEEWEPTRLLIWGSPGTSAPRRKDSDRMSPARWIDAATGQAATSLPDENTDVVLPPSETPYRIDWGGGDGSPLVARHVTVGRGARFSSNRMRLYGNVWVKHGGFLGCGGSMAIHGGRHTFYRCDNGSGYNCQYLTFNKDRAEATAEFLGRTSTLDEWRLNQGTAIIGIDSVMRPGRNAVPRIEKAGTLVLLDNAFWGKWTHEFQGMTDLEVCGGTVQGGLPERPLTRDCHLTLSPRNWKKLDFSSVEPDPAHEHAIRDCRRVSMIVESGSILRSIPAPGSPARLVITRTPDFMGQAPAHEWYGKVQYVGNLRPGPDEEGKLRKRMFDNPEFLALYDSLERKTAAWFAAGTQVDRVTFDCFAPGSLLVEDEAAAKAWTGVAFGPGNLGGADAVLRQGVLGRNGFY